MGLKRWGGAGVAGKIVGSVVIIVLLCSVPVILLFQNAVQSSGAESLTSAKELGSSSNGYFGAATPVYSSASSKVCVAFEFLGFDPSSVASFATVVSATPAGASYIKQQISDGRSTGLLVMRSYFGLSPIVVPFPLVDLTTGTLSPACTSGQSGPYMRGVGFRDQETSYLLGQGRAFPSDWYELDDTVAVYLCQPREAADQCAGQVNLQSQAGMGQLPGPPSVIATTRDQDMTMTMSTGNDTLIKGNLVELRFVLQRPDLFAIYTYTIAAMPFILIYGLFFAYLRRTMEKDGRRVEYSPERKVPAVYEIAFGVAATLVAILPLRAVLVPSSLPSLTRLDLFFSLGVALLVALSLTWVFVGMPAGSPGGPGVDPPGDPT